MLWQKAAVRRKRFRLCTCNQIVSLPMQASRLGLAGGAFGRPKSLRQEMASLTGAVSALQSRPAHARTGTNELQAVRTVGITVPNHIKVQCVSLAGVSRLTFPQETSLWLKAPSSHWKLSLKTPRA